MPLIETKQLCVYFGSRMILDHIDFSISEKEIVTIVGPNGSGKSTFLRSLIGAISLKTGLITRDRTLQIGYVPQRLPIDKSLPITVERFLSLASNFTTKEIRTALNEAKVSPLMNHQLGDLSGGQLQRVLLARALAQSPNLLILDEPTQGLDQRGSSEFYNDIEEIRTRTGCAVLMVSHELHVVMSTSDRVICLNKHICCHGSPEKVAESIEYQALFGSDTGGSLALYRHEHNHSHDIN